jgi:hypothetical protein
MNAENENRETMEERLFRGILMLDAKVLGLSSGLICGLIIFIATNWLVVKGGRVVGPNLRLLGQYFPGYRVTFMGSLIGFAYSFIVGYLCGFLVAWIYNRIALFRNRK